MSLFIVDGYLKKIDGSRSNIGSSHSIKKENSSTTRIIKITRGQLNWKNLRGQLKQGRIK
jgi:hypothetical protein